MSLINSDVINEAYSNLAIALRDHAFTAVGLQRAKEELETEILQAIHGGVIDGRNEQQRQAQARELFPQLFDNVAMRTAEEQDAKLAYDLAKIEVERVRALLRLVLES